MSAGAFTPRELAASLARGESWLVLDVREPEEFERCRIEGSLHLPLGELSARCSELEPGTPTVCVCHHGIRSAHAVAALVRRGFKNVRNLTGGIDRWALDVDPDLPRY